MDSETINNHTAILKELSEISKNLAVNTNETSNIKNSVTKIELDVKETKTAVQIQNGRVRTLENWSVEAQKIIENTTKIANDTYSNYKTDKSRIWAVVGVAMFLGGTIITLAIMAIDNKIKDAVVRALQDNVASIEYEK